MTDTKNASRELFEITIYDGRELANRQKLEDEFDGFWTFGPKIVGHENRGIGPVANGQVWTVEAEQGFNEAWRDENEIGVRTTIRMAGDDNTESNHD